MRIALIDRFFYPDLQSSAVYLAEIAKKLAEANEVTVFSGTPSSFRDENPQLLERIKVHQLPGFSFSKSNVLGRALNYLSFIFSCFFSFLFSRRFDVAMVQTTPPLNAFFVALLCRLKRIPMVYVCNDLFPETAKLTGNLSSDPLFYLFQRMNRFALHRAKFIIALGEDMKKRLVQNGVKEDKIEIIHFWADLDEIFPDKRANSYSTQHHLTDQFVVMHAGNMGLVHGLEMLIEAAKILENEKDILFVFVGQGSQRKKIESMVLGYRLNNVRLIDFGPRTVLNDILNSADLHVVLLKKGLSGYSVPSKIYSIMAAGKAVLAVTDPGSEIASLIQRSNGGIALESFNVSEIANEIRNFAKDKQKTILMGEHSRQYVEKMQFRKNGLVKYEEVLKKVSGKEI